MTARERRELGLRRCGDTWVLPGQRRGTWMRDWRRGGYKNNHRWGIGFWKR